MERRTFQLPEFRVENVENQSKIVGYGAIFNSKTTIRTIFGDFQERIAPGAFTNAIPKSDTRALYNHDANIVLGRRKAGTLFLEEDDRGLRYEIIPPSWASNILESMKRGDVDQSSFAFTVKDSRWDEEDGLDVRTILEVDYLYDVSPVTYPAYEDTEAAVRSYEAYRQQRSKPPAPAPALVDPSPLVNPASAEARSQNQPPEEQPPAPQQEPESDPVAEAPPNEAPQGRNLDLERRRLELYRRTLG